MPENTLYRRLQEHLHRLPMGFPPTTNGVEIDLLKTMYEPEEAEAALYLTPSPATSETLADKTGLPPELMAERLDRMAERGLLMRTTIDGAWQYMLVPYIVGTFEFQLNRLEPDYNRCHNQYLGDAMGLEVFGGKTSQFRVLPVEKSIKPTQTIMPHEQIRELIRNADRIVVADCLCRTKAIAEGRGCDHPLRVCLTLNEFGTHYLEAGMPSEEIDAEKALAIMDECESLGLIPHTQNCKGDVYYICNCCSCSCGIMSTVARFGLHNQIARSTFQCAIDSDACTGCGTCLDRCIFGALSIEDGRAVVKGNKCMGCGLCKVTCPETAISMIQRAPERQPDTPENLQDMYDRIQAEKGRPERILSFDTIKKRHHGSPLDFS